MPTVMRDGAVVEGQDDVTATYREIAIRFGIGGPNAARTKVKCGIQHTPTALTSGENAPISAARPS